MNKRLIVLLADDVELFLQLEKSFLQRADIGLLTAHDGRQALDLVQQHRPQLVFLDLYMPEMNGDDCCRAIKQAPFGDEVRVVMVAAAGNPADMQRCRDAGCDDILLKPISRSEFMVLSRKYLDLEVRADARLRAEVRVYYGPSPQRLLDEFSVDMSTGGLYVRTQSPLAINEQLTIRFSLPGQNKTISCQARVAWVNLPDKPCKPALPPGMGVQFVDLSLDDLHAIRRFLEHSSLEPTW